MLRAALIALLPALALGAPAEIDMRECLEALARTAATFAVTAPGLSADETLDQRGRRGFMEILRGKNNKVRNVDFKLPEEFRTHQVVSKYKLEETGKGRVLHEVRTVVKMDGEDRAADFETPHTLTMGTHSPDDDLKRRLLENLDQEQLEGAVTDFGQLILLFTPRLQSDYEFSPGDARTVDGEPVAVVRYRQVRGDQGLTFFQERTADRQPAEGEIWLRTKDLLPVRITIETGEMTAKKYAIRTEAAVDYQPSRFGLVPRRVVHRQFLNKSLMVENDLHYGNFHHDPEMIP